MRKLKSTLDKEGWDGNWYKRAYYDDGTPLGSATSAECKIDSIAQSWAILSGAGDPTRAAQAMEKVAEHLVLDADKLILLFTPPFNVSPKDPGYIKGYVPGVRENGGQYTHAAAWVVMAFAKMGDGNRAFELFEMLNPIHHSQSALESQLYRTEPYVIAGDVYSGDSHLGRGGWSWYTGSASWYYRAGLESILGFRLRGNELSITPCIPNTWEAYEISYIYGRTPYTIIVNNPSRLPTGTVHLELDGSGVQATTIRLTDDGQSHFIVATLQANQERPSALLAPNNDQSTL